MDRSTLFGFNFISAPDHSGILAELRSKAYTSGTELPILITPNVDQVVKCHRPEYADLFHRLKRAKYILPDGQPIVWVSKLQRSKKLASRLTGSDLFPQFWQQCIAERSSVSLLVPSASVGEKLKEEYADCTYTVAGTIDPSANHTIDAAVQQCIQLIKTDNPEFFLLGIGFPKQEILALRLIDELKAQQIPIPFMLLLGASFEFHVGVKKRSPKLLQRLGLEFVHRLFLEPKRMVKRYLIDDTKFLGLAVRELLH